MTIDLRDGPDPTLISSAPELIQALRLLKVHVGDPSWRELSRRTRVAHTTLASVLDQRRAHLPSLENTTALIRGLGLTEAQIIPWLAAWRRVRTAGVAATTAAWISRHDLPRDVPTFTGRTREIDAMLAGCAASDPAAPLIWTVDGMPGVGKTALAIHVGHLLAAGHPDACLYLDLRGHSSDQSALDPAHALHHLLTAVGVTAGAIPDGLAERAALWRATLTDRRALLVLDDARDAGQVLPLLPGASDCVVIVTSRRRLVDLPDVTPISLDVLGEHDAAELFLATAGRAADNDTADVAAVVRRCGRLPLAIRVAAARLRHRPTWSVRELLDRLEAPARNQDQVSAAFALSYQQLDPARQHLFQAVGIHPGADLDARAAAALLDVPRTDATMLLDGLVDVHLLHERAPGRYGMHDLLRNHAAALAEDDPAATAEARGRLYAFYLHTAAGALDLLYPHERDRHRPDPAPTPPLTEPSQARQWLDTETANLIAIATEIGRSPDPGTVGRLAGRLTVHLQATGRYDLCLTLHEQALHAARRTRDRRAEASALGGLGATYGRLGRLTEAVAQHERHLLIVREIDDREGQARALTSLGVARFRLGEYDASLGLHREALELAVALGDSAAQARAWTNLGLVHHQLGAYGDALDHARTALARHQETGNRIGQGNALTNAGSALDRLGRHAEAADHHRQALAIMRDSGNRGGEAIALVNLGVAEHRLGEHAQALDRLRAALTLARSLGGRAIEAATLNYLGEVLLALGRTRPARARHRAAAEIAEQVGDRYEAARARDGIAATHHADGDDARAAEYWHRALRRYTELGVPEAARVSASLQRLV